MSTCNFETMKDYPLIVFCPDFDYDDMKKDYENEVQLTYDVEYAEMQRLADKINDELVYHTVGVKSGYYDGLQFIVSTYEDLDFDRDSSYCIDNEDAHYYFDECRSKVLRKAEAEVRKIRKWLKSLKNSYGYLELDCAGVFSNGEAVYSIVQ